MDTYFHTSTVFGDRRKKPHSDYQRLLCVTFKDATPEFANGSQTPARYLAGLLSGCVWFRETCDEQPMKADTPLLSSAEVLWTHRCSQVIFFANPSQVSSLESQVSYGCDEHSIICCIPSNLLRTLHCNTKFQLARCLLKGLVSSQCVSEISATQVPISVWTLFYYAYVCTGTR